MPIQEAAINHVYASYSLLIEEGSIVELRALEVPRKGTVSGYFDNPGDFIRAVAEINGLANVFMTVNPALNDLRARSYNTLKYFCRTTTGDAEIIKRKWILVDIDVDRPSGISSTNGEHDSALLKTETVRNWIWETQNIPSAMFDSGNGGHLLIPIDMPNNLESTDLISRFLLGLSDIFSQEDLKIDKSTFNAGRITKVYGTMAVKGSNIPERPHRNSLYLAKPQNLTPVPDRIISNLARPIQVRRANRSSGENHPQNFDIEKFLVEHDIGFLESRPYMTDGLKWTLNQCPFNESHKSPDSAVFIIDGQPGFKCFHNSCSEFSWSHFREKVFNRNGHHQETELDFSSITELNQDPPVIIPPVFAVVNERENHPLVNLNDRENARLLVEISGGNLRWSLEKGKWLIWMGDVWGFCDDFQAFPFVNWTLDELARRVANIRDDNIRGRLNRELQTYQSERAHKAMLNLAKQYCTINHNYLNQNDWLLNVNNGTIDLATGILYPHDKNNMITMMCPVEWKGIEEQSPRWLNHVNYFLPEPGTSKFLQRWLGYNLTGDIGERKLLIMHGEGSNGKSIIMESFAEMLGDYSINSNSQLVMEKKGEGVPNDIARLMGKRFIHMSESSIGKRLDEARVKEWTGKDTVTARFLHKEFFSFRPSGKLNLRTNHKPGIIGTDQAIWDRILTLHFNVRIPDEYRRNHNEIEDEMRDEFSGILAWAIKGCIEWQRTGLQVPHEMNFASRQYREEMDAFGQFIKEACSCEPTYECNSSELYTAYRLWCHENTEYPRNQRVFIQNLKERGYEYQSLSAGERRWVGIKARSEYLNGRQLFN